MNKQPIIELVEYNTLMSLINYFSDNIKDYKVHGKSINVYQSYSDKHIAYSSPVITIELLRRKNKSIGFSNFLYEEIVDSDFFEFEGAILEYMVQINVYSNTRGEIHKWCSILDDILKNGEDGITLNTYSDNGTIKQQAIGILEYDFNEIRNNNLVPNVITNDFHTIYDVKISAIQKFKITYGIAELGNIIGNNNEVI